MLKVGFFADIRAMTGTKEITIADAPTTLSLLMQELSTRYGKTFTDFCMDDGQISRRVNILINGIHMLHLQKGETPLKDNDDVRIFPLIGGG